MSMSFNFIKSFLHDIGVVIVGFGVAFIGTRFDLLIGLSNFG